jgi:hypothetical protein
MTKPVIWLAMGHAHFGWRHHDSSLSCVPHGKLDENPAMGHVPFPSARYVVLCHAPSLCLIPSSCHSLMWQSGIFTCHHWYVVDLSLLLSPSAPPPALRCLLAETFLQQPLHLCCWPPPSSIAPFFTHVNVCTDKPHTDVHVAASVAVVQVRPW